MQAEILVHEFVGFVPEQLDPGTIYLSLTYATATHLCCCGCGREVVTPLSPTDWKLIFDGETVSLTPSIGNWSFPCQSHYWIRQSRIEWAPMWSRTEIEAGRQEDKERKSQRPEFSDVMVDVPPDESVDFKLNDRKVTSGPDSGLWSRLRRLWRP